MIRMSDYYYGGQSDYYYIIMGDSGIVIRISDYYYGGTVAL